MVAEWPVFVGLYMGFGAIIGLPIVGLILLLRGFREGRIPTVTDTDHG
jgi:hypothetical protein